MAEQSVSPRLASASASVVMRMIFLRLKLSAKCPAGSVQRIIGTICDNPTKASASAEPVRS